MRQRLFFALSDVVDAFVIPVEKQNEGIKNLPTPFVTARVWNIGNICHVAALLPSDVDKQVFCSLVDVEDFVPKQTEAGGALQGQFP